MDGRRDEPLGQETLSDEALARELERALAVEPSPSFLARTRARVEAGPIGARRPLWGATWAAGVAVLVVGAALAWPTVRSTNRPASGAATPQTASALQDELPLVEADTTADPSADAAPTIARVELPPASGLGALPSAPQPSGAVAAVPAPAAVHEEPRRATEPEVLVPESETRGFTVLLARLDQGLLDGSMLPTNWGRRDEDARVLIDVVPIEIVPLLPLPRQEGERP